MNRSFRKGSVARIGGFLRSTLSELGIQERILEQQTLAKWAVTVGPQIAASSRAEAVRDGVLFVSCKSSMWSSELSLHKIDIVKKLNAAVGKAVVKDIRFSARGFRKAEQETPGDQKTTLLDSIPLDAEETQRAEEAASACDSDELAAKVRQAILTSKRLNEAKLRDGYKPCARCCELHNGQHDLCDSCRTLR